MEQAALAFCVRLAERMSGKPDLLRDVSVQHNRIGSTHLSMGKPDAAAASHRAALSVMERIVRDAPDRAGFLADQAFAQWKLGEALAATDNGKKAGAVREEAKASLSAALEALTRLRDAKKIDEDTQKWIPDVEAALKTVSEPPK